MVREMTMLRSLRGLVCAGVLAAAAVATPASADLYVVESSVPAVTVGSRLADSDTLTIPSGSFVRAVLPSGKTQTIRGPYSGTVADIAKGQAQNEGVMAWIRNILQTGGSNEATPGATRSIGRESAKPRVGFSWSAVPVADGTVCVEKEAKLQLVRAPSTRPDRLAIIDTASATRGEAQWEAGSDAAAWPASVMPRSGATYFLLQQDRPQREIKLQVLDRLPAEADVLTELHRLGCKAQFEAWVREKMAAGKRPS
jgi:hypothetical protein